jgi:hypothetical protein
MQKLILAICLILLFANPVDAEKQTRVERAAKEAIASISKFQQTLPKEMLSSQYLSTSPTTYQELLETQKLQLSLIAVIATRKALNEK